MLNKIFVWVHIIGFYIMSYFGITAAILNKTKELPSNHYTYYDYCYAYNTLEVQQNTTLRPLSNAEYRKKLNITRHIYVEISSNKSYSLPQLNIILMQNNLEGHSYARLLTHEMLHIRKYSGDDRYIQLETFKYLYHSNDEHLKQVGITFGLNMLNEKYDNEYDIKGNLINYLKEIK